MKKRKLNLRDIKPSSEKEHNHDDGHDHSEQSNNFKAYFPAIISFTLLITGIALDYFNVAFFKDWVRIIWYGIAYLPVGLPVVKEGWESIKKGDVFTEFFLMSIATLGAFAIGEYPEGVLLCYFMLLVNYFKTQQLIERNQILKPCLM